MRRVPAPLVAAAVAALLVVGLLGAAVLLSGSGRGTAQAATDPPRHVTVDGTGMVTGTPDVLRLSIGVTEQAGDVGGALDAANADVRRLTEALHQHKVADADIQTSQVNIGQPRDSTGKPVAGFQVSESLTAKLRSLGDAGATITAAVNAGGNATHLDGVSFDLADNTALLARARDAAYAEAKGKAAQYAKLSGQQLGPVLSISEGTPDQPYPRAAAAASSGAAGPASSPVPISAGEQQVQVSVQVSWTLQ